MLNVGTETLDLYREGRVTAGRAAEILGVSWNFGAGRCSSQLDAEGIREYLKAKYGD